MRYENSLPQSIDICDKMTQYIHMQAKPTPRRGRPNPKKTELAKLRLAILPNCGVELARRVCGPLMEQGCNARKYQRMEMGRRDTPEIVLQAFRRWVADTNPTALPKICGPEIAKSYL